MPDEIEAGWRAFLGETEEHLEAADRLLSRTGRDGTDALFSREDIASLFRAFHSLKGLSLAMDLTNMQDVAHHAEDLLGIVREGRATLGGATAAMLLEVVDCLRGMREWAGAHRTDAGPEPHLVIRLEQMVRQASGVAPPVPEAADSVAALSDDEDMLALYCELLSDQVPLFAEALATGDGAEAATGAEELIVGAEVIGLDQVASVLRDIAGHARTVAEPAGRSAMVLALADLLQQLQLLEEITGTPAGAAVLAQMLAAHARGDVSGRVASLRTALDASTGPNTDLNAVVALAAAARIACDAGGMPNTAGILLLVEEQASRAAQAEIVWTPALADLARELVTTVEQLDADLEPEAAAALQAGWQARMRGDAPPAARRLATTLSPELRAALTNQQLALLEQRVAEGRHSFDLLLDTESEPDIAADIAAWLSANAEVITSRTVSAGSMSWFEFLFVTRDTLDQTRARLSVLDPARSCIRGLREVSATTAAPAAGETPPQPAEAVIRVRVGALDALLDGLDEMRVTLGSMADALTGLRSAVSSEKLMAAEDIQQRMEAMHRRLRTACLALRVVPVDTVFARYPRLVRELATRLGREVDVEIEGGDSRIDKSMADMLIDPLMHMVRNAIDHGIEPPEERLRMGKPRRARLVLSATEHSDGVHIAVRDDGRGLDRTSIHAHAVARGLMAQDVHLPDRDVYDLLFRTGFSTAAEVTEISGRGVGLDVVAHTVTRLGGTIDIDTVPGAGTTFTLRVPASASVQDVLLVEAGELVAIPRRRVIGAIMLDAVDMVGGERMVWYRGSPVRLHDLAGLLGFPVLPTEAAVVVETAGQLIALAVESVPQRREVFLKELHPILAGLPAVAGATLLSDGRAVLVLDVDGLLQPGRAAAGLDVPVAS
jgi:two-component system chemotaxis sensor kinase CheA